MKSLIRVAGSAIAAFAAFFFVYWLVFSAILPPEGYDWIRFLGSLACAIVISSYTWRHTGSLSQELAGSIIMGAIVTGTIGFLGGFVGPMIFAPDSNQGPLLGIFITGPLGVVVGAVGGAVYWFARRKPAAENLPETTRAD